jgi:hypothetical protein
VRPGAVAQARAALEAGTLGSDFERLADRMLDELIES